MQGLDQLSGLQRCDEGGEAAICHSNIHDGAQLSRGQQNRIDHMDDAVGGHDVGDDDLHSLVQINIAHVDFDGNLLLSQGGIDHLTIHATTSAAMTDRHDMVEQDVGQLLLVLGQEQGGDSVAQGCEGFVGGGEDGEGAIALQGLNQLSGLQGSYQGGEAAICHGDVDDGLGVFLQRPVRTLGGLGRGWAQLRERRQRPTEQNLQQGQAFDFHF